MVAPRQIAAADVAYALPPVGSSKFGALQSRMPFNNPNFSYTAGQTIFAALNAEAPFDWVRFVYLNYTTSSYTINAAAAAASASANDYVNPINAAGAADNTLWLPITFNSAGADSAVSDSSGSTRSVTVPAAVAGPAGANPSVDYTPGIAYSDWVRVPSLARIDVAGALPLIFCRTYATSTQVVIANTALAVTSGATQWDTFANGRTLRGLRSGGDNATTPGTVPGAVTGNYLTPTCVQFLSRRRGLSVCSFGDSLYQGTGGATNMANAFNYACTSLSTQAFPVIHSNLSLSGQSSPNFHALANLALSTFNPDVVFIKGESPNDASSGTAAAFAVSRARAMAFADLCTRKGIVPVLTTAMPWTWTGSSEAARLAYNDDVRNSGYLYADWDAAVTDGGSPARLQAAFTSSTAPPHPNDAGYTALAVPTKAALQRIIVARPR
jgi:hypothetical protein